ncbi:DUF7694 domain-containing protein [Rhodococcoides fascians]|uniref:DUF7694 domain-containing protein n=1 Tax=Rhodococcoides fascians TaxID=1828 RepID=UPI00055ACC14|nr:hypothetical protein [Rhodococcus fascians]
MSSTIDALQIRAKLGRRDYLPPQQFGPDGWRFVHARHNGSVIVSAFEWDDNTEWIHASMTRRDATPSYEDLKLLHRAVFGDGWAYQVFAPERGHVNIHEHALHLWGAADGSIQLPDFGRLGSI